METEKPRIHPDPDRPFYWRFQGRPLVLIGGSVEDNLFQIDGLEEHLDLLASVGGNYVRCTLSSRDEGNVWPFERNTETGLYDLKRPGGEYWHRLERFLELTAERGIVVQIELWDRFDFAREPWQENPYNPRNNLNYTADESGLSERIDTHPAHRESAFFRSVPALENNEALLPYQQAQVDKLLSISLQFDHVLYCMDNETNESPEWGAFWCRYIRAAAEKTGIEVQTTEMWDAHDLTDPMHDATFEHPELYTFVDVSQNNHQKGQAHWDKLQAARRRLAESGRPRPMNCVKVYGADGGRHGDGRNGQQRFWRSLIGGCAAVRFHRPPAGLGLGELAQSHIRSARMLTDTMDFPSAEPNNGLLADRADNEAYCIAKPGESYVVFFPDGGEVSLDISAVAEDRLTVRWLDIIHSRWLDEQTAGAEDGKMTLRTPRPEGYWAVVVSK
ncbi:MAG: hypothetical protein ACP5HU_06510 [Phycisphaerae bacterium]